MLYREPIRGMRGGLIFLSLITMLSGCATSSLFISYPARIQPMKQQLDSGQYKPVLDKLDGYRDNADKILYLMERGRAAQIASDAEASMEDFKQVIDAVHEDENKAKITVTGAASQGTALLTNDNAIPYTGAGYERVFVYQFQAMNYLFANDLDGALVEVRRANEEQRLALHRHENEIAKAEAKKDEVKDSSNFMSKFSALDEVAGRVKNSFQNAYTFYASGVIYEAKGEYNDAYIDYKKALEIFPSNTYLQKDVIRLAKQLGMREDYEAFKKEFSVSVDAPADNSGELIVMFEHGFAPAKIQTKVPLVALNNIHTVAFPSYAPVWQDTSPLNITLGSGKTLGNTQPIVYVQALAAKALKENLLPMMTRQVLRIIAKKQVADKSGKAFGDLGALAANIFNIASENADQRSWLTLPNDAQILRTYVAAGEHQLNLNNGKAIGSTTVEVQPGKKTLMRIIATGKTFHVKYAIL